MSALLAVGSTLLLITGTWPTAPPLGGPPAANPRPILEEARVAADAEAVPDRKALLLAEVGGSQVRAGDRDGARRTLAEATAVAGTIEGPRAQVWACLAIARSYLLIPDTDGARRAARTVEEPVGTNRVLVEITRLQADAGDLPGARHTVTLITDRQSAYALWHIAVAQVRAGDLFGAQKTLAESPLNQGPLTACDYELEVARHHARAGRFEEARRAIQAARRLHDENYARQGELARLSGLVGFALRQAAAGDPAGALALTRSIPPKTPVGVSVQYHYRTLAKYQARYGTAREAVRFALDLSGVDIQTAALREVADELTARGDAAGAQQALTEAQTLIRAARAGEVETYTVTAVHAGLGDFAAARKALDADPKIHPFARCGTLRLIAARQAATGDRDGARATLRDTMAILDEWAAKDEVAGAYRLAYDGLVRAGGLDEATARAKRLSHPLARAYALLGAAEGLLPPFERFPILDD
jgi:tetratricopeptide (TPR) repeat protein